jgi:hypothetical protein
MSGAPDGVGPGWRQSAQYCTIIAIGIVPVVAFDQLKSARPLPRDHRRRSVLLDLLLAGFQRQHFDLAPD